VVDAVRLGGGGLQLFALTGYALVIIGIAAVAEATMPETGAEFALSLDGAVPGFHQGLY
jgi:hypothetical protein